LLERRPRKLAAVALANKMARTVWAMMTTGEAYRRAPLAAAAWPVVDARRAGVARGDDDRSIRRSRTPRPDHRHIDAADLFGAGSIGVYADPIWASGMRRANRPDT
jgi:hypothetical protein